MRSAHASSALGLSPAGRNRRRSFSHHVESAFGKAVFRGMACCVLSFPMVAPPADSDADEVTVHFAEPHTTSAEARRYLQQTQAPPRGRSWEEARVIGQSIGSRGVTFRFSFRAA